MDNLLEHCRRLVDAPSLKTLAGWLQDVELESADVARYRREDVSKPYGRNVILDADQVEGMVATWTRGRWCAPHDHGGSVGGVRVLQGQARHRVFRRTAGTLELVTEEVVSAGSVMRCGADLVHAMRDGGGDEPLMTLHMYAGPIDHMVVYDVEANRTLVVDGGCGAWVPHDAPELIRSTRDGIQAP
ncbi:MAG: hypothetical protein GY913_28850 [Proteobacteria bacterium]|nr:hypothetical protein [Pseudomonadota bacterium]MCP4920923.1 hypothetical protein [Pseudomonadota bacterium]